MRFGRRAAWAVAGLALGLFAGGTVGLQVPRTEIPDHFGTPLVAPIHIADGYTFEVVKHCRIARFGVAPWQPESEPKGAIWERMTRMWLITIGMPEDGHDGAIAKLRGKPDGDTTVSNLSGSFVTSWRTGKRYVSCLDAQTRFSSDEQQEPAKSYSYTYAGIHYPLAIIERCGNVTRIAAPIVAPVLPRPPATPLPTPGGMGPAVPYGPGVPDGHGYIVPPGYVPPPTVNAVPEPSSLALMGAGLAVVIGGAAFGTTKAKARQ